MTRGRLSILPTARWNWRPSAPTRCGGQANAGEFEDFRERRAAA